MIRRASMNEQTWWQLGSELDYNSKSQDAYVNVVYRDYKGDHFRVLNDLMGLTGFYDLKLHPDAVLTQDDVMTINMWGSNVKDKRKIDYHNIGMIKTSLVNAGLDYRLQDANISIKGGLSSRQYQRTDYAIVDRYGRPRADLVNGPLSEKNKQNGYYAKVGGTYRFNPSSHAFVTMGRVESVPKFDEVFPDYANIPFPDASENKPKSDNIEFGYGYTTSRLIMDANYFSTTLKNYKLEAGYQGKAYVARVDEQHRGVEMDVKWMVTDTFKLTAVASFGDYGYDGDGVGHLTQEAVADLRDDEDASMTSVFNTKGLKIANMPQTIVRMHADYQIMDRVLLEARMSYYDQAYSASWNALGGLGAAGGDVIGGNTFDQIKLPSAILYDMGATFCLMKHVSAAFHVENLFDSFYLDGSVNNPRGGSELKWKDLVSKSDYVWPNLGRRWSMSLRYRF